MCNTSNMISLHYNTHPNTKCILWRDWNGYPGNCFNTHPDNWVLEYQKIWVLVTSDCVFILFSFVPSIVWYWKRRSCIVVNHVSMSAKCMNNNKQQQPFCGPLSGTTRVSRYQQKHSPTHPPFWSSSNLYQLLPSTMIHSILPDSILPVQIMCLAIFLHNLCQRPLWSSSWSGALDLVFHTFLHLINVFFSQHMPILSQPVLL